MLRQAKAVSAPQRIAGQRRIGVCLRDLFDLIAIWGERWRQRRALAALDDRLLGDIGLTRADVAREAAKPFWAP
jgi:uncharacterized protein YjiS (DUF1127 family)